MAAICQCSVVLWERYVPVGVDRHTVRADAINECCSRVQHGQHSNQFFSAPNCGACVRESICIAHLSQMQNGLT
eukprot:6417257-Ditylum_brightwellii.AAC.1